MVLLQLRCPPSMAASKPTSQSGANVAGTVSLNANDNLTSRGVMLGGSGFIVTPNQAKLLALEPPKVWPSIFGHIAMQRPHRDSTQSDGHRPLWITV